MFFMPFGIKMYIILPLCLDIGGHSKSYASRIYQLLIVMLRNGTTQLILEKADTSHLNIAQSKIASNNLLNPPKLFCFNKLKFR